MRIRRRGSLPHGQEVELFLRLAYVTPWYCPWVAHWDALELWKVWKGWKAGGMKFSSESPAQGS